MALPADAAHALLVRRRMNHKLLIVAGLLAATNLAHADAASDRVFLVTGAAGCPTGQSAFKRIRQSPDGTQVQETAEFVVPAGKYLEITSIEYTTPYWTAWAKSYTQQIALNMRQRVGTGSTNVFVASFNNRAMYDEDANDNLHTFGQFVATGAQTLGVAYPTGPLMSSAARLCFSAPSNFFTFNGSIRVRGRLIANDSGAVLTPSGSVLEP
jgi:hypothetical protein